MTPADALSFFSQGVDRAAKGLAIATSTRNFELLGLNLRQLFKCHLVRGLVLWRDGRSPVADFATALGTVRDNALAHSGLGERLPLGRACLLAALLEQPSPVSEIAFAGSAEERLDFALALRVSEPGRAMRVPVDSALSELEASKRTRLAAESYRNYFAIVDGEVSETELDELISRGETLYIERGSDAYFGGADQSEGGGQDNPLVLDYRLALAVKIASYRGAFKWPWVWGAASA